MDEYRVFFSGYMDVLAKSPKDAEAFVEGTLKPVHIEVEDTAKMKEAV